MKKLAILFAGLFIMAISVQNVNAQTSATQATPAAANIISIIEISLDNAGLNFGTLVPSGTDGTVTVPHTGVRSTNNVGTVGQDDDYAAAAYTVTGEEGYTFSIDLPADETITITDGTNTMDIDVFTASLPLSGNSIASGGTPFTVGATLSVGASQPAGLYEGSFDVTVAYE